MRAAAKAGRVQRWGATLLATAALAGCSVAEPPPVPAEPPLQGWLIAADDGCAVTSDQLRTTADGLQRSGLSDAGYATVVVACAGDLSFVDRSAETDYLRGRGVSLRVLAPSDARVRSAIDARLPADIQRTAVTRAVMAAESVVVSGDARVDLSPENAAVLTNGEVLHMLRDDRRAPGAPVREDPDVSVRAVGATGLLVSLTNSGADRRAVSVDIADLNLSGDDSVAATDLWTGQRLRAVDGLLSVDLDPGASALLAIG